MSSNGKSWPVNFTSEEIEYLDRLLLDQTTDSTVMSIALKLIRARKAMGDYNERIRRQARDG